MTGGRRRRSRQNREIPAENLQGQDLHRIMTKIHKQITMLYGSGFSGDSRGLSCSSCCCCSCCCSDKLCFTFHLHKPKHYRAGSSSSETAVVWTCILHHQQSPTLLHVARCHAARRPPMRKHVV
ncbi:hypothetical protein JOB18_024558 [Solea senegalensis]|uniref:Uncharacterized protein n=1 Tax=Solea senegalensis TaxID=28829 RepID=A0AAV6S0N5_SOLSE|nr:hypothetical protein JOB18_024558 [Solea senegalensis]